MRKLLLSRLRLVLFVLLDSLVLLIPRPRSGNVALVIRLDALGDFALWLQSGAGAVFAAARAQGRNRVVLAANVVWAQFAQDLGCVDEVIPINIPMLMRRPFYRFRMLARLRRAGAHLVIQPRSAKVFLQEDEIVRTCGASRRVGAEANHHNIDEGLARRAALYYTDLVGVRANDSCHESVRNMLFARWFDPGWSTEHGRIGLPTDASRTELDHPYMVVAPGAGWVGRQWPVDSLAAVIRAVHVAQGLRCVVVGSAADSPLATRLVQQLRGTVIDRTGQCTVLQTAHIMAAAELVISNESGPMHLAIWCGAPVVGVVGGGHFGWFAPYPPELPTPAPAIFVHQSMPCFGCAWKCRFPLQRDGAVKCVDDVDAARVISASVHLLAGATPELT